MDLAAARVDPERFDRLLKLLVDAGQAPTFEAARELASSYRLQLDVSEDACASPAWQAALLTTVNAGVRAVHGGVSVRLAADPPCSTPLAAGQRLSEALRHYGANIKCELDDGAPRITFGGRDRNGNGSAVRPWAGRWLAGVGPPGEVPIPAGQPSTLAAVLAAAMALSECFGRLRGNPVCCERTVGISLWRPDLDWRDEDAEGPEIRFAPSEVAILGLGHLGQAYAWLLALLPYATGQRRHVLLIDDDRLSPANRATSMLDGYGKIGAPKVRAVAAALEALGWETVLVERRYRGGQLRVAGDPPLLLAGVDNREARALLDETGFPVIYDAGLGAGPDSFLGIAVRRLPGGRPSREIWRHNARRRRLLAGSAYEALVEETGDRCGVELLAGATVATAFVGVAAACLTVGGIMRELHGGCRLELVDFNLREPGLVAGVVPGAGVLPRIPAAPLQDAAAS